MPSPAVETREIHISGPLLFGNLIGSGKAGQVAIAFYIGSGVMALGGVAEIAWGIAAERRQLEDVAEPLTAEDADQKRPPGPKVGQSQGTGQERRFRPGPGRAVSGSPPISSMAPPTGTVDQEVSAIRQVLHDRGPLRRREVYDLTGATYWGPGVFRRALGDAVARGLARRASRDLYTADEHYGADSGSSLIRP